MIAGNGIVSCNAVQLIVHITECIAASCCVKTDLTGSKVYFGPYLIPLAEM
jgi:hypothetical protein